MIVLDAKSKKKIVDVCIDAKLLSKELIQPLRDCELFSKVIDEAILLEKYSPKKVRMPIY